MHYISKLIEQLSDQLRDIDCTDQGRMQLKQQLPLASLSANQDRTLLNWLGNQTLFPCFYWYNRDGSEEVVVCGAVIQFDEIKTAHQFIDQNPESEMRVWGLNCFDQLSELGPNKNKGCLFLPRIEISRSHDALTVAINLYSQSSLKIDAEQALKQLSELVPVSELIGNDVDIVSVVHQPEQQQWCQLIDKALLSIRQKQFDKVVLARKTTLMLSNKLDPVQFIHSSKQINHGCFHFMMRFDDQRAFLGSSPERLYYRDGYQLVTEALAGTIASSTDNQEAQRLADWLMNDDKNQHENMLVVDDISQRLNAFVKKIIIQPVEIIKLRKVQHLRRGIRAELNYINDVDCLHWLQPTAAVAGLPRQSALNFILENEPFDREWYAGSAGYLSYKKSEFSVTLRSALIEYNHIHLYAGAGIVEGSDPLYEWLEIENKAAALQTLLNEDKIVLNY